jgi:serine/threonine-protein kinase RsbW
MKGSTLTIENAVLADLPRIIEFVVEWLQRNGLSKYSFKIETAVDEASSNVIKYAYGGRGGHIGLSCKIEGRDIVITIQDRGKRFEPDSVSMPDVGADLENRKIGGLGIYMMKKMMDVVTYRFNADAGNELELRKTIEA